MTIDENLRCNARHCRLVACLILLLSGAVWSVEAYPQTFDSGSDGSDADYIITRPSPDPAPGAPFNVEFNPADFAPRQPGNYIFQFRRIAIGHGVTIRMRGDRITGPVFWLATEAVEINGTIDLNGEPGQNASAVRNRSDRVPSVPGAGGFTGGIGKIEGSGPDVGAGPGGGGVFPDGCCGGGAGYSTGGGCTNPCRPGNDCCRDGGRSYGNEFILPLIGGSGGGGGTGAAGGAGGGALLIASSIAITLNGEIHADGGRGGISGGIALGGGGGSGGAIRLLAPTITGAGIVTATGGAAGSDWGGSGANGRIRFETFNSSFTGTMSPPFPFRRPYGVFVPTALSPQLEVVSVNGISIVNPAASFTPADVQINTTNPVPVVIRARNIPLQTGTPPVTTIAKVHVLSENAPDAIIDSGPFVGTDEESVATASVRFPTGFARAFVKAAWDQ